MIGEIILALIFAFTLYGLYFIFIKAPLGIIRNVIEYIINMKAAKRYTESQQSIIEELEKNNYLQTKQIQQKILEKDKEENRKKEMIKWQNDVATATINKTNELRTKYQFADEELFKLYQLRYPVAFENELKEIENNIIKSHKINSQYENLKEKTYTLKDLDGIIPLEHINEDPIVLKLFKMDNFNYVIYVRDIDTGHVELLNSNDYIIVRKTMSMIKEKQHQLAIRKEKISSTDITNIYDNVKNAVLKMKESGSLNI